MREFNAYLRLQEKFLSQGVLLPFEESRLERLVEEMRDCYFLPEKYSFYISLSGRDQAIYRRRFLSI